MPQLASAKQAKQLISMIDGWTTEEVQRLIRNGDLLEILRRVDPSEVDRVLFERFIAGELAVSPPLFQERYTPGEIQVMNLRVWNSHINYYEDSQIDEALADMPVFDWREPFKALVLCWTQNTLAQTLNAKLYLAKRVYGKANVRVSSDLHEQFFFTDDNVKLVDAAPDFVPNRLWWEVLDLGSVRNVAPDKVDPTKAAGTQVFDAALQHKEAVRRMDGGDEPYWDVPALRVNVPWLGSWLRSLYVHGSSDGCVRFGTGFADLGCQSYVGPLVVSGKS